MISYQRSVADRFHTASAGCGLRRDRQRAALMDGGHAMNMQRGAPFFVQPHCISFAPQPAAAVLHPCRQSPPDRRDRSRQRSEKTEGKIKGRGTSARRKPGLHGGWRGTRFLRCCAVCGAKAAPALVYQRASPAGLGSATPELMP